jgi:hypothetical protein
MTFTLGFIVGILLGWQVPQPKWVQRLWDKLAAKIKEKLSR